MPALYILIGVAGMALALIGVFQQLYLLVALGVAMIFAAFFLFARTNQGTPAPAGPDDASRGR
ncbi:MAG TPA: hypothetical protein VM388_00300 [Acidimicrobiales bacterium]|nr:hypothetical protein [Acidimicrobiales bacterium]